MSLPGLDHDGGTEKEIVSKEMEPLRRVMKEHREWIPSLDPLYYLLRTLYTHDSLFLPLPTLPEFGHSGQV